MVLGLPAKEIAGHTVRFDSSASRMNGDHHVCPTCGHEERIYKRSINKTMVIGLLFLLRGAQQDSQAYWSLPAGDPSHHRSRDTTRLRLWGLIEEELERREDGGRKGFWRITPQGVRFARGITKLPKYALTLNGRVLGYDGPEVDVYDAYKEHFDLREVLGQMLV